jgi:hypothetical protein
MTKSSLVAKERPRAATIIAVLMLLTTVRFSVVFSIPGLEMFGGIEPDAWIAPWVSDTILGMLAPLMAWLAWRQVGPVIFAVLVAYNCLGAFDYAHGLATQWIHPQVGAPFAAIFGFIAVSMLVQLIVIGLLFQRKTIAYYCNTAE